MREPWRATPLADLLARLLAVAVGLWACAALAEEPAKSAGPVTVGAIETLGVVERQAATADDKDLLIERDVEYGRAADVVLKLNTYRLKAARAGLLPAVIRIHGGGWMSGEKGGLEVLKLEIKDAVKPSIENLGLSLARRGYFAVDISYRLVPAARFPAAIEDCKCAVRWLRENAKKYSVDPDRIGAVGASAGGHLALLLACADEKAGLEGSGGHAGYYSRIQAAVSWYGPTDFTAAGHSDLYRKTVASFVGVPYEQNKERYRQASPITYVSPSAPPVLLVHGEEDPAVAFKDSQSMAERLKAVGADVTLIPVKHAGHDFRSSPRAPISPSAEEIVARTIKFFDKHLRNRANQRANQRGHH